MNNKKLLTILGKDRELLAMFSGIILTGIAAVVLLITAGAWYL